jgi:hypothetical protein
VGPCVAGRHRRPRGMDRDAATKVMARQPRPRAGSTWARCQFINLCRSPP